MHNDKKIKHNKNLLNKNITYIHYAIDINKFCFQNFRKTNVLLKVMIYN